MTVEREALDKLISTFPGFDLLRVDWQLPDATRMEPGPWLLITLGQRSEDLAEAWQRWEFSIWKRTGDIYMVRLDGTVGEEPFMKSG